MSKKTFAIVSQLLVLVTFVIIALACASTQSTGSRVVDGMTGGVGGENSSGSSDGSQVEVPNDSVIEAGYLFAME